MQKNSIVITVMLMPEYRAQGHAVGPLLGRYGTADELDKQIGIFSKRAAEYPSVKDWNTQLVEQYTQIKKQLLQNGPESLDPLLRQYTATIRARLDAKMAAPSKTG